MCVSGVWEGIISFFWEFRRGLFSLLGWHQSNSPALLRCKKSSPIISHMPHELLWHRLLWLLNLQRGAANKVTGNITDSFSGSRHSNWRALCCWTALLRWSHWGNKSVWLNPPVFLKQRVGPSLHKTSNVYFHYIGGKTDVSTAELCRTEPLSHTGNMLPVDHLSLTHNLLANRKFLDQNVVEVHFFQT